MREGHLLAKPLSETHIFLILDDNDEGTGAPTSRRPAPRAAAQQGERKW
jgi:hypothetical protein